MPRYKVDYRVYTTGRVSSTEIEANSEKHAKDQVQTGNLIITSIKEVPAPNADADRAARFGLNTKQERANKWKAEHTNKSGNADLDRLILAAINRGVSSDDTREMTKIAMKIGIEPSRVRKEFDKMDSELAEQGGM